MPGFGFFAMLSALAVGLYAIWSDEFRTRWELYWARLDTWTRERDQERGQTPRFSRKLSALDFEITVYFDQLYVRWKHDGEPERSMHFLKWYGVPKDIPSRPEMERFQRALDSAHKTVYRDYERWEEDFEASVSQERRLGCSPEGAFVKESGHISAMLGVMEPLLDALQLHARRRLAIRVIIGAALVAMALALFEDLQILFA